MRIQFTTCQRSNACHRSRAARHGFTLVELLLVISIIAILASMLVGVMAGAREDANVAATKARMRIIERVLLEQIEEYEVRRLPITLAELQDYVLANPMTPPAINDTTYVQAKNLKRRIIADLLNSEMPRAFVDNTGTLMPNPDMGVFPSAVPSIDAPTEYRNGFRAWLDNEYSMVPMGYTQTLGQRLSTVPSGAVLGWQQFNTTTNPPADPGRVVDLPSEYLYKILNNIQYQGTTAVESLGSRAVGDTDSDGHLEIVDAWGDPLEMRIFQVAVNENDPSYLMGQHLQDIFVDFPDPQGTNWTDRNPTRVDARTGLENTLRFPLGYASLNPAIPRPLEKIVVDIVSPNMRDIQD